MPRLDRPLNRDEIAQLLRNIADHPPCIDPGIALEAMVVTASSLAVPGAPATLCAVPASYLRTMTASVVQALA